MQCPSNARLCNAPAMPRRALPLLTPRCKTMPQLFRAKPFGAKLCLSNKEPCITSLCLRLALQCLATPSLSATLLRHALPLLNNSVQSFAIASLCDSMPLPALCCSLLFLGAAIQSIASFFNCPLKTFNYSSQIANCACSSRHFSPRLSSAATSRQCTIASSKRISTSSPKLVRSARNNLAESLYNSNFQSRLSAACIRDNNNKPC